MDLAHPVFFAVFGAVVVKCCRFKLVQLVWPHYNNVVLLTYLYNKRRDLAQGWFEKLATIVTEHRFRMVGHVLRLCKDLERVSITLEKVEDAATDRSMAANRCPMCRLPRYTETSPKYV